MKLFVFLVFAKSSRQAVVAGSLLRAKLFSLSHFW